jgi:D-alanyl-D-alanine carboxypeptidase
MRALLFLAFAAASARALAAPPAPLVCLERHYAVRAVERDGAWLAQLPDGRTFPYDDGRQKSFEERLAAPDVEDTFSIRYRKGPIRAVTTPDEDPGRIRLDALFQTTYPERGITHLELFGKRLAVHEKVAPAFQRVERRLKAALAADPSLKPFLRDLGGTFAKRNIAGTNRPSAHSYGVSIDLNVALSHYWRWQKPASPIKWSNRVPQAIVDAFEAEGFIWGGRWYHYDTMHFEYRPELLDPDCYPEPAGGAAR